MSAGLPQQNGSDTKDRLLDAAEQLFAEHGIDGASMRAITHAAGTSVSAANYHFGSKDELVRAAFSRRVVGLNQQRLTALESLESQPEGPKLEEVVDAFLRPILEAHVEQVAAGPGAQHFQQIAIRIFTDAPARVAELREELFGPLHRRFAAAIRAAVPGCNDVQAERALQLTVALLVHLNNDPQLEAEQDTLLDCMVRYSIAGIRAVVCNDSPEQPLPRMAVTS
jgi:AcrR family transcriptional regulator